MRNFTIWIIAAVVVGFGIVNAAAPKTKPPTTRPTTKPTTKQLNAKVEAAEQQLEAARAKLATDKEAVNQVVTKLQNAFESSSPWTTAQEALRTAQAEYEKVRDPILSSLKDQSDYKAATARKEDARQKVKNLEDSGAADDQIAAAASEVLDASKETTRMEQDALSADPKFADAKAKLDEASAKSAALRAEFDKSLTSNSEWVADKAAVSADEKAVATAESQLETAEEQAAEAANKKPPAKKPTPPAKAPKRR